MSFLNRLSTLDSLRSKVVFFLKALFGEDFDLQRALEVEDKTGLECSINNLYIQSIIVANPYKQMIDSRDVLIQGIHYAYYLAEKISPTGHFKIILSYSKGNEPENIVDCSVRFHLIREGENWISENLDDYKEEAILVFE